MNENYDYKVRDGAENADLRPEPEARSGEPGPSCSYSPGRSYTAAPLPPEKKPPRRSRRVLVGVLCLLAAAALGVAGTLLLSRPQPAQPEAALSTPVLTDPQPTTEATAAPVLEAGSMQDSDTMLPEDIYALACRQVVGVTTEVTYYNIFGQSGSSVVSGTGLILTEDGYILTNYHVIEDAMLGGYSISVLLYDGTEYTAEVVGVETDSDLAVLKIAANGLSAATLGDSDETHVGQTIYTVGNPLGELSYTMTSGIVSATDRSIETDPGATVTMFQIDAAVNSGNSGGPVYNTSGQVIGIVTAKYGSDGDDSPVEGLGFAIPISDARFVANEIIANGYVSGKASLGITPITVSASTAQYYSMVEGAYIYAVDAGSCAETAGLLLGDIIVSVDDSAVADEDDLVTVLRQYHAGDSARITVYRGGDYLEFSVTFDEAVPTDPTEVGSGIDSSSGELTPGQYYFQYEFQEGSPDSFRGFR